MSTSRPLSNQLCACGCGQHTAIGKQTVAALGYVAGEPRRYIVGHNLKNRPVAAPRERPAPPQRVRSDQLCACGCGQYTNIARKTEGRSVKGQPCMFARGHGGRALLVRLSAGPPVNPSGLCQCGCGRPTGIATHTLQANGWIRGQPKPYLNGHNSKARDRDTLIERLVRDQNKGKRYLRGRLAEGYHTAQDIRDLLGRQGSHCYYCGADIAGGFHVDHKMPLERGGSQWPANLALACDRCNRKKWMRTEDEFWDYLAHGSRPENIPCNVAGASLVALQRQLARQIEPRWSRAYPTLEGCRVCGTSKRRHCAKGLCKRCYRAKDKVPTWAKRGGWMCCQACGTTEQPHYGEGLCKQCYSRLYWKNRSSTHAEEPPSRTSA